MCYHYTNTLLELLIFLKYLYWGKNNDGLSVINCGAIIPPKLSRPKGPGPTKAGQKARGLKKRNSSVPDENFSGGVEAT
jgi:hypothetical protein